MGIMDKAKSLIDSHKDQVQEGINKGKDLVNKTMGGHQSASTTAPQDNPPEQAADTDLTSTDPGVDTPAGPTGEV